MGSARDFFSASVADALLPAFRRPFEDVIYETLDTRQVPTRTDFKELRDQINSLRGQLTGATGGVKKLADDVEGLADRLAALEGQLGGGAAPSAEALAESFRKAFDEAEAVALGRLPAAVNAAVDAGLDRLADALTERVAERLGARLAHLEAHLSEAWLNARLVRLKEDILAEVNPRVEARPDRATVDLRLARLRAELDAALAGQMEALRAEIDEVTVSLPSPHVSADGAGQVADLNAAETGEDHRCRVAGCTDTRRSKGFCARHYQQWRRGRLPEYAAEE